MNKVTEFTTARQWVTWLKKNKSHKYELSAEEWLAFRDAIVAYAIVAEQFFYHTIKPMCLGFVNKVVSTYNVTLDVDDVATWIFVAMYDGGRYTRLQSFRGEASLFAWVSACGAQIIYKELEYQHIITKSPDRTPKNTSLTLLSMKDKNDVMMVLDLVEVPQFRELLEWKYIKRMSEEEMLKNSDMSEELFKSTLKNAETTLKENLIHEEFILTERDGQVVNLVTEALSDHSGAIKTSTSEEAMLAADNMFSDDDEFEEVKETLEQFYPGLPWREQWIEFVMDRAMELNWNDEDVTVFTERFYNHADPVALAKRLGRARTWVDNKFSRQNKAVIAYIKKWWAEYGA